MREAITLDASRGGTQEMSKRSTAKPAKRRIPAPPQAKSGHAFTLNPNLNRQTRKVLGKHYRAKYGVK